MNSEIVPPEIRVPSEPSLPVKLLFWLILGALSVFFAEVAVASDPYPFLHAWGLLVVIPLYLLHILVLGRIAFQAPRLSFGLLFLLGIAFGFYEAYMTKVIWDPPWGPMYYLGGIAPIQTAVLTLWWHPWMAFIIPLLIGETFLTGSREIAGTFFPWLQRNISKPLYKNWVVLLFLAFCGLIQSSNAPTPELSVLSLFSTGIVLAGIIMVWRWITWGKNYSMRSLMPQGEQFWALAVLLFGMYAFLGMTLRSESMGSATGQAVVAAIYVVLGFLVFREIWISRTQAAPDLGASAWSFVRAMSGLALIIITAIGSHVFLGASRLMVIPISWLIGAISGIIILVWVVYQLVTRRSSASEVFRG